MLLSVWLFYLFRNLGSSCCNRLAAIADVLLGWPTYHRVIALTIALRVWTSVLILVGAEDYVGRTCRAVEVGPGGLNLTPFSRLVCRHPDYEIHFVQFNIMIAHTQLPLRLAVAAFLRTALDDGTCPPLTEMVVAAVPEEMRKSSLVLTSGQVLCPFEDSPHITHDGVILHGRSAPQRAMVYHILYQTECLPSPGCAVGLGQARPPEPGEAFVAFPFTQLHTLPAVPATTNRPAPPIPPWLMPQPVQPVPVLPQAQPAGFGGAKGPPQTSAPRSSAQLGVYALQALTEQDVIAGHDAPHARLIRELITRARNVRALACDIQRTLQNLHSNRQHLCVQPGITACWTLASEMDTILGAVP